MCACDPGKTDCASKCDLCVKDRGEVAAGTVLVLFESRPDNHHDATSWNDDVSRMALCRVRYRGQFIA
jgi:hypothetical protein